MNLKVIMTSVALLALAACSKSATASESSAANTHNTQVVAASKIALSTSQTALSAAEITALESKLSQRLPGFKATQVKRAPIPGWFEVVADSQILYVSANAKYLFSGQLFSLDQGVTNLTEASKRALNRALSPLRKKILAAIPDSQLVVYKADPELHRIDVFVDIDCGYCRKLHHHIKELTAMGITVRYLGFPRAGLGSSSYKKLVSVWCATDREKAMDRAFLQRQVTLKTCPNNPIASHYALVRKFGINGTPSIILANGDLIPGYVEPKKLLAEIERLHL